MINCETKKIIEEAAGTQEWIMSLLLEHYAVCSLCQLNNATPGDLVDTKIVKKYGLPTERKPGNAWTNTPDLTLAIYEGKQYVVND